MADVVMPQLGETVIEGTILRWLKQEGESVAQDEPLLEISTDKVDTEVPSSAAGIVTKILVPEGETVAVGTKLAEISGTGAGAAASPGPAPIAAKPTSEAAAPAGPARGAEPSSGPAATTKQVPDRGPRSQILSPLVRKLADERGVDLSQVAGTGTGGRITKDDVLAAVAGPGVAAAPVSEAPASGEEIVPISHIRRTIAEHMKRSLEVSARAWNAVEIDMENVARLLARVKEEFRRREGFNLTYTPFVARAACDALLAHPMVNSELRGDDIVVRRYVNLGVAVSYDEGLIVPVVRGADAMTLPALARTIDDLAKRARAHQLKPDEVHGGTFTITNPGPFGSLISVPIINQPQTAILAFDAVEKRPVVIDDAIAIRHRVYMSMSWDHRVIDGALATQFLVRLKRNLETWDFAEDLGLSR